MHVPLAKIFFDLNDEISSFEGTQPSTWALRAYQEVQCKCIRRGELVSYSIA